MSDETEATKYAYRKTRKLIKSNSCALCEQVDCEGCEFFGVVR